MPWYADCSWRDIRDIIPSLLILFIGNLTHLHLTLITELILPQGIGIMILIIPYAFASVIKQLQMEEEIARWPILGESPPKKKSKANIQVVCYNLDRFSASLRK